MLSKPSKKAAASLPPEGPGAAVDPETTATKQVRRRSREHQAVRCSSCAMGTSSGESVPYRPHEPNPRIPRKESKTPASHMHLPPFLAAVSSKPPIKSPSSNTATRVQGPPRAAAFKTKDFRSTVPLPFPLRAAFAANECCASPALPKKNDTSDTNSRNRPRFQWRRRKVQGSRRWKYDCASI
ncbi:hypothetical protein MRX96_035804 [Rhipicephalus microplus]